MEGLRKALEEDKVDHDIIPLLDMINALPNYFTTSSCSERISVMEMPYFGDKVNSVWLGKWHREVPLGESGEPWVDEAYLERIVALANAQVRRFKGKLKGLEGKINRELC